MLNCSCLFVTLMKGMFINMKKHFRKPVFVLLSAFIVIICFQLYVMAEDSLLNPSFEEHTNQKPDNWIASSWDKEEGSFQWGIIDESYDGESSLYIDNKNPTIS